MMFKERWTLLLVAFLTAFIVFFMPMGGFFERKCRCPEEKCPKDPTIFPHDMIVIRNSDMKNGTRKKMAEDVNVNVEPKLLWEFQRSGWVVDCVTWEPKWESPTLEAQPHIFSVTNVPRKQQEGEEDDHREQLFAEIFKKKDWPANDPSFSGLQASGPGAMLRNAIGIMSALHVIITKLKQHLGKTKITMLDLPCGDLQWMRKFLLTRNDVIYTGADIVPEIIDYHKNSNHPIPRTRFIQHDIVRSPLNESYDLILCRDMLQHLWRYDAMKALHHFSASNSKFLLATTFPGTSQNGDVEKDALGGRKFSYNLELPPFSLVAPVCSSYDWNVEHVSLWSLPLKQKYEF